MRNSPFRFIMCMGVSEILYQLTILLSNNVVNMCFAMLLYLYNRWRMGMTQPPIHI